VTAPRLVLASASPARLTTLQRAGLAPEVEVSGVDEGTIRAATVQELVSALARAKAEAVATRHATGSGADGAYDPRDADGVTAGVDEVIIGCDSMLELDGLVLGKPADGAEAVHRWRFMRGRSGVLYTGHHLVRLPGGSSRTATAATTVYFADLDDAEIEDYVATGEPLMVAGAFTIDGLGGPYVTRVEGDHHNVVGISLPLLRLLLADLGVSWISLRRSLGDGQTQR
jgi:septum formation protein